MVGENRFSTFYIATGDAKEFWKHSRRIPAVDACHLKTFAGGIWMGAAVKDANNQVRLLAQSHCASETKESWKGFLQQFQIDFKDAVVFLSDKDKGGQAAMDELGIPSSVCAWHLKENLRKGKLVYNDALGTLVWSLAASCTREDFEKIVNDFDKSLPGVAASVDYIVSRKSEFVSYIFLDKGIARYGDATSNIIENINSAIGPARVLPIISMILWILKREESLCLERAVASTSGSSELTPGGLVLIENHLSIGSRMPVSLNSVSSERVLATVTVNKHHLYKVLLDGTTGVCLCRCARSLERGYPCDHGLAVFVKLRTMPNYQDPKWNVKSLHWVSAVYSAKLWKQQYEPIAFAPEGDFLALPACPLFTWETPPATKGRPSRKRKEKMVIEGEEPPLKRRTPSCGACGEKGHYRGSCQKPQLDMLKTTIQRQSLKCMRK